MPPQSPRRPPHPSTSAAVPRGRDRTGPPSGPPARGPDALRPEPAGPIALLEQQADRAAIVWRTWMAPWAP
jgi:hypothetical protein